MSQILFFVFLFGFTFFSSSFVVRMHDDIYLIIPRPINTMFIKSVDF